MAYVFTQQPAFAANPVPRTGVRFKQEYDMKEELGKGGFGTVRRCVSRGPNRAELAAKINNTPDRTHDQIHECTVTSVLSRRHNHPGQQPQAPPAIANHPPEPVFTAFEPSRHIVNLFDSIVEGDIVYNMYEIASGGDLQDEIARREFFSVDDAREAFIQICEGVHHMHQRGWLHRDLKPQNILIEHKKRKVYKVADFGLACQRRGYNQNQNPWQQNYTEHRHGNAGTPMYNCPQKWTNQPYDRTSDWWSVGCILYYMLAGYPPFYGTTQEIQNAICNQPQPIVEYNDPEWADPDLQEARQLLMGIFVHTTNRPDYTIILADPFVQGHQRPPMPAYTAHDFTLLEYEIKKTQKRNILRGLLGLPADPMPVEANLPQGAPPAPAGP